MANPNLANDAELSRQYRVLNQMITMHAILRDRYSRRALFLDIVLLSCSVIFAVTTFAKDDLFVRIGLKAGGIRFILEMASVFAFLAAVISLRIDWKGRSAAHREAVRMLTDTISRYREKASANNRWQIGSKPILVNTYWKTMDSIPPIPDQKFVSLKGAHVRKVQLSTMLDKTPGCPIFILRIILMFNSIFDAIRNLGKKSDKDK